MKVDAGLLVREGARSLESDEMKSFTRTHGLPLLAFCVLTMVTGCRQEPIDSPSVTLPAGVSWASMLSDAADLRTLAGPVDAGASSRMSSSCSDTGKVILANLAPQILGDMDHGFFPEVVDDQAGVRATLAEFDGPGAVTWVWSANPSGALELFIDGQKTPALRMSFTDFLGGRFLPVREPYASVTSLGHNLHFPIVHAKHCKLVLRVPRRADLAELFYQVAWQSLPATADIHPFDVAEIGRDPRLLKQFARRILAASKTSGPLSAAGTTLKTTECSLGPGQSSEVFRAKGAGAIAGIRVTAPSKEDVKGLWLEGTWDGTSTLRAPLHMLAGVSAEVEDTESLPATVDGPQVTLRWFMPYAADGRLMVSNAAARPCTMMVDVWTQPIDAARYPLRFHANFLHNKGLRTDGGNILTLAEEPGPGRFVGCVLGVDSRSDQWWGEGDHLIWLDNQDRPAWHGTGTEDYFGFAWCSQGIFNHPFRGQPRVAGSRAHRIAQMHRYHLLDRLPFQRWGRFQFEAWGLGSGEMDWMSSVMWYSATQER
jgi:hypothetical protein